MLDGGERRGGTGNKKRRRAGVDVCLANMLVELFDDVDDVAETGRRFVDLLGLNGAHATA